MKTKIYNSIPKIILAALIIVVSACSKDTIDNEITENSKATIFEIFEANTTGTDAYKNAPGDTSIAEIAIANADFNELVAALVYVDSDSSTNAGLVDLFLNGNDQFTVFAPTDEAFMNLYAALSTEENTITSITQLPADLVLAVLQYHVTEGRRAAKSVVPKKNPRTIETLLPGATFQVTKDAEIMAIGNSANFVPGAIDISASNGIIHVIDTVILPIG